MVDAEPHQSVRQFHEVSLGQTVDEVKGMFAFGVAATGVAVASARSARRELKEGRVGVAAAEAVVALSAGFASFVCLEATGYILSYRRNYNRQIEELCGPQH